MAIELTFQAGSGSLDGSTDPKLGITALRLKLWAPTLMDAITGTIPGVGVALVENQPRTYSRSEAGDQGGYEVMATVEGHLTPAQAEGTDYRLEGTTSEDPIETHPAYALLLALYNGTEDSQTKRASWPRELTEPGGRASGPNRMHGVESFLVPGLTWTRTRCSQTLDDSIIRALGTIDEPPGNPPELSGSRNWLKISARATWRGNVWQIEETWLLSAVGGWVLQMYARPA